MIKALLFDLDGVLVNAMPWHEEAFLAAVRVEGGIDIGQVEHAAHYAGRSTKQKLKMLVDHGLLDPRKVSKVAECKQRLTETYIEQRCVADMGRVMMMQHLKGAGYTLGCVTNCIKRTTLNLLERTQLLPFVEGCVITNEDVTQPKPSPEPYQKACGLAGVMPQEALVFEDHDVGLKAAFAAGCYVKQVHRFEDLTIDMVWEAIESANLTEKGLS